MKMSSNITGFESSADLMELRRANIRSRRQKKAERLFGVNAHMSEDITNTVIIPFPAPDYPLTA